MRVSISNATSLVLFYMKILHTSDWHLGQSFFTKSRKNEHAAFLKWLLQQVEVHQIDAIIVAGDVFDTGTPPSYARELYHAFIGELQGMQCTLVVLGGNHDSVSVLNESKALLKYLNSHVIASTYGELSEQVITLNDRKGQPSAVMCAVPFIRPRDVLVSEAGQSGTDKRQALGDAIKQHYGALYNEALSLRASIEEKQGEEGSKNSAAIPIIATGHLTALGVSQSESVRDIYIGTLEGFDAKGFPPAVSGDSKAQLDEHLEELSITYPIAYGLSQEDMAKLGLYISTPRSEKETDHNFAEPALFVLNEKNEIHIAEIANAPFVRPDLEQLVSGLEFIRNPDNNYPIRGTYKG